METVSIKGGKMKLYLVKDKGRKNSPTNFWGLSIELPTHGQVWCSLAFYKKSDAKKYIENFCHNNIENLEIVCFEDQKTRR